MRNLRDLIAESFELAVMPCVVFSFLVLAYAVLGGICSDYSLRAAFGVDVPAWADAIIGVVGGEVLIPASLVLLVLEAVGVSMPLF